MKQHAIGLLVLALMAPAVWGAEPPAASTSAPKALPLSQLFLPATGYGGSQYQIPGGVYSTAAAGAPLSGTPTAFYQLPGANATPFGPGMTAPQLDVRKLFVGCQADLDTFCPVEQDIPSILKCLEANKAMVSKTCQGGLAAFMGFGQEGSKMLQACEADLQKHCSGPDAGAPGDCLFRNEALLGPGCRLALQDIGRKFGPESGIEEEPCVADFKRFCSEEQDMHPEGFLRCMSKHVEEVQPACRTYLGELVVYMGCAEEVKAHCGGMDRRSRFPCLQTHREELGEACRLKLADHEGAGACDAEAKRICPAAATKSEAASCLAAATSSLSEACRTWLVRQAAHGASPIESCEGDIQKFCGAIPPGSGRTLACLLERAPELSAGCQAVVQKAKGGAIDAQPECAGDAARFCSGIQPGQGRMFRCLKDRTSDLSSACRGLVSATDRAIAVRGACKSELDAYCSEVARTGVAMIACLSERRSKLSDGCKDAIDRR